eukprot:5672707-Amphidinium_carterae.1
MYVKGTSLNSRKLSNAGALMRGRARGRVVWACGRAGVWACGCVGVWACGRVGVWACGRARVRACVRVCACWTELDCEANPVVNILAPLCCH